MDYRNTPPPGWETRAPSEYAREADRARAMLRTALHYAPDLVEMFRAWAHAWEARSTRYGLAVATSEHAGKLAVAATLAGRNAEARRHYRDAVDAARDAEEARASSYPSYLETIPNRQ